MNFKQMLDMERDDTIFVKSEESNISMIHLLYGGVQIRPTLETSFKDFGFIEYGGFDDWRIPTEKEACIFNRDILRLVDKYNEKSNINKTDENYNEFFIWISDGNDDFAKITIPYGHYFGFSKEDLKKATEVYTGKSISFIFSFLVVVR